MERILVINPGSTSTKIAVYDGDAEVWKESISHTPEELDKFPKIIDELDMRTGLVMEALRARGEDPAAFAAIAARGGPIAPFHSGAYEVNGAMVDTIRTNPLDQHASILGAAIAHKIAGETGKKAYIYDAVTVDEMLPEAKVTGLPWVERRGQGHNLNMRAAAIKVCADEGLDYGASTLIVAHLGGGISVSLHMDGRIADIVPDEDGCFSPERAGCLPITPFLDMCYSGEYTKAEMVRQLKGKGGLMAYFGTNDSRIVEQMALDGDEKAKQVYGAMALNVAKSIGRLAPVACGRVDRIVLTGGIAHSAQLTGLIARRVSFLAPVVVVPGENEMQALANGILRVLRGGESAREYQPRHQDG